jgi:hypothetical protein
MTAATLAMISLAVVAGAQTPSSAPSVDARWQPWLGCWQPSDAPPLDGKTPVVCVSPLPSGSAVEVALIEDSVVKTRDTIDASGVERKIDKQGCAGTEVGQWSADNRRVFVHSLLTCAGGLGRTSNTIVAVSPSGDWINVQTLAVANTIGVRTMRYRDASSLTSIPAAFAHINADRQLAVATARADAGAPLDAAAVLEAVRHVDTTAVQSWIIARGTKFNLTAKQLAALADGGIPSSITDVMIGVSYPEHFALKQSGGANGLASGWSNGPAVGAYGNGVRSSCASMAPSLYARNICDACQSASAYDPFGQGAYDDCAYGSRYSLYSPYAYGLGYSPYSLYSPYYGGYYTPYYGYSTAPVVIVRGSDQPHGHVVNGHGYTQSGATSASSSGSSRSYGGSPSSTSSGGGSSASAGSSGSSGSSASSGSSGGSGRTAVARPPL